MLTLSKSKRVLLIALFTLVVLSVFLVATFVSSEVNWSPFDFIVGGTLVFSFGLLINYILQKVKERKFKIFLSLGVILVFLIIWAELAVGIF